MLPESSWNSRVVCIRLQNMDIRRQQLAQQPRIFLTLPMASLTSAMSYMLKAPLLLFKCSIWVSDISSQLYGPEQPAALHDCACIGPFFFSFLSRGRNHLSSLEVQCKCTLYSSCNRQTGRLYDCDRSLPIFCNREMF